MNIIIKIIKNGFEGQEFTYFASVSKGFLSTQFPDDEVIIPETYQGYPVTHLGYVQDKTLAHVRDHDYHHPSQGSGDYFPTEYHSREDLFGPEFPSTLKRFFIPKTIKCISNNFFDNMKDAPNLVIEIDPENPYFELINNKVVRKGAVKKLKSS